MLQSATYASDSPKARRKGNETFFDTERNRDKVFVDGDQAGRSGTYDEAFGSGRSGKLHSFEGQLRQPSQFAEYLLDLARFLVIGLYSEVEMK